MLFYLLFHMLVCASCFSSFLYTYHILFSLYLFFSLYVPYLVFSLHIPFVFSLTLLLQCIFFLFTSLLVVSTLVTLVGFLVVSLFFFCNILLLNFNVVIVSRELIMCQQWIKMIEASELASHRFEETKRCAILLFIEVVIESKIHT